MNCSECKIRIADPVIDGGTAYWICSNCGNCITRPAVTTTALERLQEFEAKHGFKLPESYLNYVTVDGYSLFTHSVIRVPDRTGTAIDTYLEGDGYREVGPIFGIGKDNEDVCLNTIFCTEYMTEEWQLPERLVLLSGDGHEWLAFDYREHSSDPPVILIESESCTWVQLASNFRDFLDSMVPYDQVYDQKGKPR